MATQYLKGERMKYTIGKQEEEQPVRISMTSDYDGDVRIFAEKGERQNVILEILNDGYLFRNEGIDENFGFQLDEKGRIKECQ